MYSIFRSILVPALVFFLLWLPVSTFAHSGTHTITLVYSGNLDGELEPCGCSEGGNKGGIKRRAQKIDELREQDPHLFLISAGGLISSEVPQDKLKAEYILKGLEALDYDAIGVQWRDLAYGADFLKRSRLPLILSNQKSKVFYGKNSVKRNHVNVSFFSWLDPDSDPQQNQAMGSSLASSDTKPLAEALAAAKKRHHLTILSTTLTAVQAQKQLPLENVDILILKAKYEHVGEPQKINHALALTPGSRGMRLGKLQLAVDKHGNIKNWQHEIIPLPPKVKDAERMQAWYDEYNAKVKADYEKRVAIRKKLEQGKSPFAGEAVCQNCHKAEHDKWFDTRHAEAFYALQDVNKAFDPECIQCHTVGFNTEGGFIDPAITENLMHVQCENCHGPAKEHADSGGKIKTANASWLPEQMCRQCHVQKHSPDFKFKVYWPKIAHGKP